MIGDYFEQAQLAQAAYALNLNQGMSGTSADSATYIASLKVAGMPQVQAEAFANEYTVIDQYNDDVTGFSGTVFKDKAGNYHMAIRGTTDLTDWSENFANIGSDGIAIEQGVSLYNWYQRLTAPAGSTVSQVAYHKEETDLLGNLITPAWLESYTVSLGQNEGGELLNATSITVAGHSLGGHLANIMGQFAPDIVSKVYTYNAPNFDTNAALDWSNVPLPHPEPSAHPLTSQGFFDMFYDMEMNRYGQSVIGTGNNPVSNFRIEGDLVSKIGYPLSGQTQTELFSESINGGFYDSHTMGPVVDALAVYDLMARLDPGISLETIGEILQLSSKESQNRLEATLSTLGDLFGEQFPSTETTREELYQNIHKLTDDNVLFEQVNGLLSIESLTDKTAGELASEATTGIATRYALVNQAPFAVTGDDGLYAQHNTDGELDLYDPQTGQGSLTTNYLNDRAAFLVTQLEFNDSGESVTGPQAMEYHDLGSGMMVTVTATSGTTRRIVFGSDGNDLINYGGSEVDHLYGGKGDDLLEGKGGADYLEGGKDFDTYKTGDGDTLFDVDGQGRVLFGNRPLKGGRLQADGSYKSDDGVFTYRLEGKVLTVTGPDGELTIENFTLGDLGIEFDDAAQTPGDTTHTILGDLLWQDFDSDESGIQTRNDDLGNKIYDGNNVVVAGQDDELYDSAGNDHIQSKGGDDVIDAWRGGDDHIEAGAGKDIADGGAGGDLIEGGAGTDLLAGGDGNDQLYAEEKIALADFLNSDTGATTNTRDWLAGGSGDDLLVGSHGENGLAGGGGDDVILAGAGDDNIFGDHDWFATEFDWSYSEVNGQRIFQPILGEKNPPDSGADIIYAGTGNDHVWAGAGDDVVLGGDGGDSLVGEAGNYTLLGEVGEDVLFGDAGYTDLAEHGNTLSGKGNLHSDNTLHRLTA